MSSKKFFLNQPSIPHVLLFHFFFLLFIFVSSCTDSGVSFPGPNRELWCAYNVSFNEGTSQQEIDKQKEMMRREVMDNVRSTEDGIQCDPSADWVKVDDLHWQLEVTLHCFRVSDTSTVRPPAGTKPPPSRVSDGTVVKSGCPEDDIKK